MKLHATSRLGGGRPAVRSALLLAALLALVLPLPGCGQAPLNYLWYLGGGLEKQKQEVVTPGYHGLDGKSTAVIVSADDTFLYEYPGMTTEVCRAVSSKLHEQVKDIKLTNPSRIDQFVQDNPYWDTYLPKDLLTKLKVDRLVYVDISDFTLHEKGNKEIFRGTIDANVSVAELDAKDPDNFVYARRVVTTFPADNPVGLLDSDDKVIQVGLLKQFALYVGGLFNEEGATVPKAQPQ